ncbi:MAG TPA: phosphoribosylamine--glycine ligase [Spirochaetota bacterium]|nr:phosphoribosylamine--glycine ligase [Spirochaetota bacterium]HPC39428.1 phosphoribosylamine--glycine ligase [Spirochaetota bacterium]HPL17312.1 phosphoribosylamine--glycine ligase [Spirochaetota bacterium]HQF06765.1 phosphoribosylamine--glycine ligase [Spirochaetota bacterium]HQH95616.1 phosphoribosylamine--glycine ligase [Spirochaetota bacterium]
MKYLIIGSGGREHTIAWRLLNDGSSKEVYVAPGNGGIDPAFCADIPVNDFGSIERFCRIKKIDMVVVGPEAPLVDGIVDFLNEKKIPVFGPSQKAAQLEGSKLFAKYIMGKYGIPTARHLEFTGKNSLLDYIHHEDRYPLVIKLDGLAAGKGVGIPENRNEALDFINATVREGTRVFVEDFISGEEASVLCVSDGKNIAPFVAAQDHKRIYDGDKGPNTGGMGAYAPAPVMTDERFNFVRDNILQKTVDAMNSEGIPFKGILYAGIIVNGKDINVLEFNVRFGDPEAQVIIPLMEGRLGDILQASVNGTLDKTPLSFKKMHAITVVIASGGYPGHYETDKLISGLDRVPDNVIVFHAGTKYDGKAHYTSGGRVLNVTAFGNTLREARDTVYRMIDTISFEDSYYRRDIAHRALE